MWETEPYAYIKSEDGTIEYFATKEDLDGHIRSLKIHKLISRINGTSIQKVLDIGIQKT